MGEAAAMQLAPGGRRIGRQGYIASITGATQYDMWYAASTHSQPATAIQVEVLSSDNTQDKAAGTGALTVKLWYLTTAFVEKTEVITMNGTTVVPSVGTDIFRIQALRVESTGTNGSPIGNITLRTVSAGATHAYIAAGSNNAYLANYTVPVGYTLLIDTIHVDSTAATLAASYAKFTLKGFYCEMCQAKVSVELDEISLISQQEPVVMNLRTPLIFPAGTDIRMVVAGNASTSASAVTSYWNGRLIQA